MQTTLADLNPLDKGLITAILAEGEIRRRLLDMGLVRGSKFKVLRKAPLGDPIEIFIKRFNLSLRVEEAKTILVEKTGIIGDGRPMDACRGQRKKFWGGRL